jgi:hypothetical protein
LPRKVRKKMSDGKTDAFQMMAVTRARDRLNLVEYPAR